MRIDPPSKSNTSRQISAVISTGFSRVAPQEQEDDDDRQHYDQHQPPRGTLLVLELAAQVR